MSPRETIGDSVVVYTAEHPPRSDSAEYRKTRAWLVGLNEGCIVCGGDPIEDHHGGGIHDADGKLIALNLIPLEWSEGWGSDPEVVQAHVTRLNGLYRALGVDTYDEAITDTASLMAWVDSPHNASVPLCKAHHTGHESQHTPDANGHEAVGIHHIPLPIWAGQITCNWAVFDMWAGSTGTIAVAPAPEGDGSVDVLHVTATHPDRQLYRDHQAARTTGQRHTLPAHHPHARLAHAGAHVHKATA